VLSLTVVATAFVLVLPVELPDKTLFASLVLATRFPPLPVFVGVGTAFGLQVAIAVTAGSLLSLLPEALVSGVVAVLFLVGAVLLWRSASSGPEDAGEAAENRERTSFLRAAAVSFGVLFAAEWGDLSQLATAGLAAGLDDPVSVFAGSLGRAAHRLRPGRVPRHDTGRPAAGGPDPPGGRGALPRLRRRGRGRDGAHADLSRAHPEGCRWSRAEVPAPLPPGEGPVRRAPCRQPRR
jgi:putative Ca2+/H+ antiporter (TMEM165/GDT1 family)